MENAVNEKMDALACCPICGEKEKIRLDRVECVGLDIPQFYYAICQKCGAATKNYITEKEAKEAWNNGRVEPKQKKSYDRESRK